MKVSIFQTTAANRLPSNKDRSLIVHSLIKSVLKEIKSVDYEWIASSPATRNELLQFHSEDYIDMLKLASDHAAEINRLEDENNASGVIPDETLEAYGLIDDCPVFDGLWDYVTHVAGSTLSAARHLIQGKSDIAIHFDGGRHHAFRDKAAGFCYINDIVLGIMELHSKFPRIMYIDIDVHHCDGVESAFKFSAKVLRISFHVHEPGFFPGTGSIQDIGKGKGKNHSINIPLSSGLTPATFLPLFKSTIESSFINYNPSAIVFQCGVDGHGRDPLVGSLHGGWNLDARCFGLCMNMVKGLGKPVLVLGGGGYDATLAARCWTYVTLVAGTEEDEMLKLGWDMEIPSEHVFWDQYGPDDRLLGGAESRNGTDENNAVMTPSQNASMGLPEEAEIRRVDGTMAETRQLIANIPAPQKKI